MPALPTATRSPGPCDWPTTRSMGWPFSATPTLPCSRILAGSTCRPEPWPARWWTHRSPRSMSFSGSSSLPAYRSADRTASVGSRPLDRVGQQQRWPLSDAGSPAAQGGDGVGPLGHVAPRSSRVAGGVDRLRRPGGDGVGPGRRGCQSDPSRRAMEHTHARSDRIPPDAPEPAVIHYHQEVDRQGLIRMTGTASIDGRIAEVNSAIREIWAQASPDTTYREWLVTDRAASRTDGRRAPADPGRLARCTRAGHGTRGRRRAAGQPGPRPSSTTVGIDRSEDGGAHAGRRAAPQPTSSSASTS